MRACIAAALCAATIVGASFSAAAADVFAVELGQRDRQYRNTGTITLRDPATEVVLGTYTFATGGFGRGSAPFGAYELGVFRDVKDDPHHMGPRWMIRQEGLTDGQAYDPDLNDTRTDLELHAARHRFGSKGCIAVVGGEGVWADFVRNLSQIVTQVGHVAFMLAGNPEAAPAAAEASISAERQLHPVHLLSPSADRGSKSGRSILGIRRAKPGGAERRARREPGAQFHRVLRA